jgi:hypothetical protein
LPTNQQIRANTAETFAQHPKTVGIACGIGAESYAMQGVAGASACAPLTARAMLAFVQCRVQAGKPRIGDAQRPPAFER